MEDNCDFYLFSIYPKKTYDDLYVSFKDAEITDLQTINIHKIQ